MKKRKQKRLGRDSTLRGKRGTFPITLTYPLSSAGSSRLAHSLNKKFTTSLLKRWKRLAELYLGSFKWTANGTKPPSQPAETRKRSKARTVAKLWTAPPVVLSRTMIPASVVRGFQKGQCYPARSLSIIANCSMKIAANVNRTSTRPMRTWQCTWETLAPDDHPYLKRKQVEAFGLRREGHLLVTPLRDADGKIWSLQYISDA